MELRYNSIIKGYCKWQPLGHDMETMYLFHHLGYEYAQRLFYVPYR